MAFYLPFITMPPACIMLLHLLQIYLLINNAGLALGTNPVQDNVIEDMRTMLETNVLAVMALTKACLKVDFASSC
jgi:NADP-dependent 3-hydroxy acid dehydrogenase YdfG